MRVEFIVTGLDPAWIVKRGQTSALRYESRERATRAAENFARAATQAGDMAVVKVVVDGQVEETRSFAPEDFRPLARRAF